MDYGFLVIIFLIIICFIVWQKLNKSELILNIRQPSQPSQPPPTIYDTLREYDYRTLSDPLVAPRKRDDYNLPIIPIPTRGYPSAYKKWGTLIDETAQNDDPFKFLFLVGRQKYPHSDWYQYYATQTGKNQRIKFDVHNRHKEIMSGDTIHINELGKDYTAKVDRNLDYEYYPYF